MGSSAAVPVQPRQGQEQAGEERGPGKGWEGGRRLPGAWERAEKRESAETRGQDPLAHSRTRDSPQGLPQATHCRWCWARWQQKTGASAPPELMFRWKKDTAKSLVDVEEAGSWEEGSEQRPGGHLVGLGTCDHRHRDEHEAPLCECLPCP